MPRVAREPEGTAVRREAGRDAWPFEKGSGLWGNLQAIQNDPLPFYRRVQRRHGDMVRIRFLPGFDGYLIADPSAVEHVLRGNHKNYRKPDMFFRAVRPLTGQGIFSSEGERWLRQRRLVQPAFLKSRLPKLSEHVTRSIAQLIEEWELSAVDREIDVCAEMMRGSMRIVGTALFSNDVSTDADELGRAYRIAFAFVSDRLNGKLHPPLWIPTPKNREYLRAQRRLDQVVLQLIEARRRSTSAQGDVLDLLLAARDEETGRPMSDQQLKDEVITLLTAGHETVGAGLAWAWHLLAQHPPIQQALHEEAKGALGGALPSAADLPRLPLATAVFEESMRLYPPAWGLPRESIAADELGERPLPAKATLILSQWLIHRHPKYWTDADAFRPERFLPSNAADCPRFAYFPFGGGPRVCIGNAFAMIEGPLVLAGLAQKFELIGRPGFEAQMDSTFTLRPKQGVPVVVRRRI